MSVNGYFNIMPDNDANYCNADSTITRIEFLSAVARAEMPVSELTADANFEAAVGANELNIYAQEVAGNSYLTLTDKSLNNMTANGTITRAEVIYTLVSRYYADELANVDISTVTFTDCINGGDIATEQGFESKEYCTSYELTYALTNPDKGCPDDIYRAMVVAYNIGLLDSTETRWDEAVTKAEVIEFIINAHINDDSITTFNYNQGTITGYEAPEDTVVDENTNPNDIGHEYAPTEEEEVVEEETTETTEDETQTEENQSSFQWPDEETRAWFGTEFGLSEDELNNMTQQRFDSLLQSWLNGDIGNSNNTGGNSGGSTSGGSSNSGPENGDYSNGDTGGLAVPQLNPGDGSLPGSM